MVMEGLGKIAGTHHMGQLWPVGILNSLGIAVTGVFLSPISQWLIFVTFLIHSAASQPRSKNVSNIHMMPPGKTPTRFSFAVDGS